jgi:hypothetical protein
MTRIFVSHVKGSHILILVSILLLIETTQSSLEGQQVALEKINEYLFGLGTTKKTTVSTASTTANTASTTANTATTTTTISTTSTTTTTANYRAVSGYAIQTSVALISSSTAQSDASACLTACLTACLANSACGFVQYSSTAQTCSLTPVGFSGQILVTLSGGTVYQMKQSG